MKRVESLGRASLFLAGIGYDVCSPFFDPNGTLCAVLQSTGEIISINNSTGQISRIHSTGGQPNSAVFDSTGILYIADFAHASVLAVNSDQQDTVVAVYEDRPLKGPNGILCSNGKIYFTDSGPLGETGLHSPSGSLFLISNSPSGQILKPLSLANLSFPTGIAVSTCGNFLYVAEMMTNRILRFFQQPEGVFHCSVFYQLSGGVGPSSIAIDKKGNIYVGQYDTKESSPSEGTIYVISKCGKFVSTISTPAPEISGLAIKESHLYVSEKSTGSIYRVDI